MQTARMRQEGNVSVRDYFIANDLGGGMTLHDVWLRLVLNLDPAKPKNIVLVFNETCGIKNAQVWCGNLKVAIYDHPKGSWVLISPLINLAESNSEPGPLRDKKLYQSTDTQLLLDEKMAKYFDSFPNFP